MKATLSNDELMVLAIYQQPTFAETKEEMLLALPFTEEDPEVFELLQETIYRTESMSEEKYQALLPTLHDLKDLMNEEDSYE